MDVPPGWTTLIHPEGVRYFVNQENVRQVQQLLKTDGLSWSCTRRERSRK